MTRVCFATPGVLPMLRKAPGTVYGGSELRAWRFARGLVARGFTVSMVVPSSEFGSVLSDAGILPVCVENSGVAGVLSRFFPLQRASQAAWAKADADVYLSFGASDYSADLADWCRAGSRKVVLCSGSDVDFSEDFLPGNSNRNTWGNRCDRCYDSMTRSTAIVVQTEAQLRLLKGRYHRDGYVVRNPAPFVPRSEPARGGKYLLWVGKAVANKGPDMALDLARRCPNLCVRMVINRVDNEMFSRLSLERPCNVNIVESVSHEDMPREYENAFAFLSTSIVEGFPNTFLEAAAFGLPIFSLYVDPEGVIECEGGGAVAGGNVECLAEAVRRFYDDPQLSLAAGWNMLKYVKRVHGAQARIDELAALVADVAEGRSYGALV